MASPCHPQTHPPPHTDPESDQQRTGLTYKLVQVPIHPQGMTSSALQLGHGERQGIGERAFFFLLGRKSSHMQSWERLG